MNTKRYGGAAAEAEAVAVIMVQGGGVLEISPLMGWTPAEGGSFRASFRGSDGDLGMSGRGYARNPREGLAAGVCRCHIGLTAGAGAPEIPLVRRACDKFHKQVALRP